MAARMRSPACAHSPPDRQGLPSLKLHHRANRFRIGALRDARLGLEIVPGFSCQRQARCGSGALPVLTR